MAPKYDLSLKVEDCKKTQYRQFSSVNTKLLEPNLFYTRLKILMMMYTACQLIPMAAHPRVWVCVHQLDGIAGSNPAEGHGWMSVVCCWVEVSAKGQLLVQRGPSEGGVSKLECDLETSTTRKP